MHRMTPVAALIAISLVQGCATAPPNTATGASAPAEALAPAAAVDSAPSLASTTHVMPVAHMTEVPVEKNAPPAEGHPLTSVVVTQCNLIVAVYLTMPDGRLLRFDKTANIPADQLISMAYTATRSERVEVSCEDVGAVGYEPHEPL
jgi:hypothetical protein